MIKLTMQITVLQIFQISSFNNVADGLTNSLTTSFDRDEQLLNNPTVVVFEKKYGRPQNDALVLIRFVPDA